VSFDLENGVEDMVILTIIGSIVIGFMVGIFFSGLARKVRARIHWRYGPPLYQPIIDIVKLFHQGSVSHGFLFDFGILLSLGGVIVTLLFIPIGNIVPLHGSGGLLVVLYLMLIAPFGIALSSVEAANPNASIGISRKFILALGYEIPFLLVVLSVMTHYGTTSFVEIVEMQRASRWGIISMPFSGIALLLILPAMMGMKPFDQIGAPQEISSGPSVEYGGVYLALLKIQHVYLIFIDTALFVALFMGGGLEPLTFFLKMLLIFFSLLLISTVYPRFRIEQAFGFCIKWPTIIAFLGLLIVIWR